MKKISHRQSRRNSARRKRKVEARRRRRARRLGTRSRPVFGSGRVHYEIGARINATSHGGIGAVRRLVWKLGLPQEIDRRLKLLKRHLPYHESDHVLNIVYNLLCGGVRLDDLNRLRSDTAYMDAVGADMVPSPSAAGDFMRRFAEADVAELMECINAVRPKLWRGRGRDLLGPVAYVDVDGTLAPTLGNKKAGMDMSYTIEGAATGAASDPPHATPRARSCASRPPPSPSTGTTSASRPAASPASSAG